MFAGITSASASVAWITGGIQPARPFSSSAYKGDGCIRKASNPYFLRLDTCVRIRWFLLSETRCSVGISKKFSVTHHARLLLNPP